jgi:hypothetical protein
MMKPKYSLSTRNKCVYLLEASKLLLPSGVGNTPTIAIFRMCYGENGTMKFLETFTCSKTVVIVWVVSFGWEK